MKEGRRRRKEGRRRRERGKRKREGGGGKEKEEEEEKRRNYDRLSLHFLPNWFHSVPKNNRKSCAECLQNPKFSPAAQRSQKREGKEDW